MSIALQPVTRSTTCRTPAHCAARLAAVQGDEPDLWAQAEPVCKLYMPVKWSRLIFFFLATRFHQLQSQLSLQNGNLLAPQAGSYRQAPDQIDALKLCSTARAIRSPSHSKCLAVVCRGFAAISIKQHLASRSAFRIVLRPYSTCRYIGRACNFGSAAKLRVICA